MKRGQAIVIGILVVLLIVLGASFYFYYFGVPNVMGRATDVRRVTLVEKGGLADNLLVPQSLEIFALIDRDNVQEFSVSNYNDKPVNLECTFPPFQPEVPSSYCFSYDSEGKFVGAGSVTVLPGRAHVFTAVVRPYNKEIVKQEGSQIKIDITPGEYSGEIELHAFSEEDEARTVSVIFIPVKIVVGG